MIPTSDTPTEMDRPTLEQRVEALEETVARLADRLESTLEVNNLWDGT